MLNTDNWKEFLLKDICRISMGNKLDFINMTSDEPAVNFVGRSADNNGVADRVDLISGVVPYEPGCLTVALGGSIGCTYLQTDRFYTSQNVSVLEFGEDVTVGAKLFISVMIMNECKYKYVAFGRELNVHIRTDFSLYLPAVMNEKGGIVPDWEWMESFMAKYYQGPLKSNIQSPGSALPTDMWEEFRVGNLFDVKKGKRLTSEDQTEGDNIYIGAIDSNNGVAAYIGQAPIHNGNTISLSYNGSIGEAFYQPDSFWATDDVNVLYLKSHWNYTLNAHVALFICAVLRQEKYRYAYGRKWTLDSMKDTVIKLPATTDTNGQTVPDWDWMEQYMKSLAYSDFLEERG